MKGGEPRIHQMSQMYVSGACNWFITGLVVYELSVVLCN